MTLCAAWIRKAGENEELVFATDSCLSMGERWPTGIKLFDLPRKDVLICFAGRTERAYPLILNLITTLQYSKDFQDRSKDVSELALFVSNLFTQLVSLITQNAEPIDELKAEANFLFGGWSWRLQQYVIFRIYYRAEEQQFVFEDSLAEKKTRQVAFIGDFLEEAKELYYKEFEKENSENLLDMEPLKVLTRMSRNKADFTSISGAIQIAKIYKSGYNEFFGVMWPSIEGKPHFLGKEYQLFDKPDVRYFDPDTLEIHELPLPERLREISEGIFNSSVAFVEQCYPNGIKRNDLTKKEKQRLFEIFKNVTYLQFLESTKQITDESQQEEIEEITDSIEDEQNFETIETNIIEATIIPADEVLDAQPEITKEEN